MHLSDTISIVQHLKKTFMPNNRKYINIKTIELMKGPSSKQAYLFFNYFKGVNYYEYQGK